MLSFYFTTVGFYCCSMLTVFAVYLYLYGRVYLALSGLEKELLNNPAIYDTKALQAALASQSMVQMGFLMALPMIMVIGTENGFHNALFDFVVMQLQLAPVFFTFQLGTKAHYYCKTLLHGGAKYMGTGRGFVVVHAKFVENYRMYSYSHFFKAFELMILLLAYHMFGNPYMGAVTHFLVTFSIWFMVGSWLFAPFIFNPSGFEWHSIMDDWKDWKKWIYDYDFGELAIRPENSWVSWWEEEQEQIKHSGKLSRFIEIVSALRFFVFPYGLVYQLTPFENNHSVWVCVCSWLPSLVVILTMIVEKLLKIIPVPVPKSWRNADPDRTNSQVCFRIAKVAMFLTIMAIFIYILFFRLLTLNDIYVCTLAFISNGWGMLLTFTVMP
ncbi:hypothetical protein N665_0465s0008 [Sinapis alba]|nr:hypothetical protein N665_0465s0008 [Sinapis alba]